MKLEAEIQAILDAGTDWIHFDVIDGVFAPNLTIGVPVLKKLRAFTDAPIDAHLMICNPLEKLTWFLDCSPDIVTIHWEALEEGAQESQARQAADAIHAAGAKAGIALKPDTPVSSLFSTLDIWDMVLVMSVFPGFSGQSYIPTTPDRIAELVTECNRQNCAPRIQVDGGISAETAPLVAVAGADVFVAGNAVFKHDNYTEAIEGIRSAAARAQAQ